MNKQDYEKMSDFELSRCILESEGWEGITQEDNSSKAVYKSEGNEFFVETVAEFDINDWSDVGPVIFSSGISLIDPVSLGCGEWQAGKFYTDFTPDIQVQHKNPPRAAAIVYLLMKDNEK